jgi:hypothetical protein
MNSAATTTMTAISAGPIPYMVSSYPAAQPMARAGGYDAGMVAPPQPGDLIRINDGAFQGFVGSVLERGGQSAPAYLGADPEACVLVELNIFGRNTRILVHPALLEPA